ncbi:MAG: universal stress protein [Proteobacteria bacterium]|nr:universal stress protein [Pseudomonadota bacterium]
MLKKILVPTDLSATSYNLLDSLKVFKNYGTEEIVLMHAIDTKYTLTIPENTIEETQKLLENQAELLTKYDFKITTDLRTGTPWKEIVESAKSHNTSLILIGSHGRSIAGEIILGSVTSELIEQANMPILIIKMTEFDTEKKARTSATKLEHLFDHVLFPTDFSEENKACKNFLKENKNLIKKLTIIYVQEPILLEQPLEFNVEELDAIAFKRLEDIKKQIGIENTNLEVLHGKPSLEIIDYIESGRFNLVAMGTRGLGLTARILLGSNARYVIRHSKIPVLIIPQK